MQKLPTKHPLKTAKLQCSILSLTVVASDKGAACNLTLEHHTYNSLTDTWVMNATRPQPFINITFGISQDDYTALGHPLSVVPKSTTTSGMAHTGCQSCLAGVNYASCWALEKPNLSL